MDNNIESITDSSKKKRIRKRRTRTKKYKSLNEEANDLFNKFMDAEEKEINRLEYSLLLLQIEEENENYINKEISYYESLIPIEEKDNYGWEEMKAYFDENDWYHECDVCLENTRNGDCKCADVISKCDMTYIETHIIFNHFIKKNKAVLIPKTVKNVPILTLF